jgi:hypothetical protein
VRKRLTKALILALTTTVCYLRARDSLKDWFKNAREVEQEEAF